MSHCLDIVCRHGVPVGSTGCPERGCVNTDGRSPHGATYANECPQECREADDE